MYKWYALKRILRGVVIYSILIFIFSFLFNQINEKVQRSQIMEMVRAEAKGLKNMTAEQIMAWRKDQELTLIRQYKLDRPLVELVLHNAKRNRKAFASRFLFLSERCSCPASALSQLIVLCENLEECLRVLAGRTYLRCRSTDHNMSAIPTYPDLDFALLEDFLHLDVL